MVIEDWGGTVAPGLSQDDLSLKFIASPGGAETTIQAGQTGFIYVPEPAMVLLLAAIAMVRSRR